MKKFLLSIFSLLLVFTLIGCNTGGKGTVSDSDLKITYFNGGYGSEWITKLAQRFTEATGHTVELVASSTGNCGAENQIKTGSNLSDIYIGEGIPWQTLLEQNKLEQLSEVYDAKVTVGGQQVAIKDFMDQNIINKYYCQRRGRLEETEYLPYAMPFTAQPNAMAYNYDILKEIKHVSGGTLSEGLVDSTTQKWIAPPKTLADYRLFLEDVVSFNNGSAEKTTLGDTHDYVGLGFCGLENINSLACLILTWWASGQGLGTTEYPVKYQGEYSFFDFFNYGNSTTFEDGQTIDLGVYNQTGFKNAFNILASLIVDDTKTPHVLKNTITSARDINLQDLQKLFVATEVTGQKPVITIASSYLENEAKKYGFLDSDENGIQDCNFFFMNIPQVNALEAGQKPLLHLNFSDCIVVPKNNSEERKAVAKEFLIFMCSEQEVINFSKETSGGIRPFNCNVLTNNESAYSEYAKSVFNVYYNSTYIYEFPVNAQSADTVSNLYRYDYPSFITTLEWQSIVNYLLSENNPGQYIYDMIVYNIKNTRLSDWKSTFYLTDITK